MRFIVVPIFSDQRTGYCVKDSATGKIRGRFRGDAAQQKATAKAAAMNQAISQQARAGGAESGNVFFTLFAAVALVGVVGSATMSLMRGPLSTASAVNQQVRTDSRLMVAGRIAALAAADTGTDCDGDGVVEPLPPATGAECADAVAAGGGCLPGTVGGDKADPWGTPIMYCAYDHGTGTMGCPAGLRTGNADPTGRAVLAVISAGGNRTFETTCGDDPAYVVRAAGDDRVYVFDESEAAAVGAGGGLWTLKSGDPNTATIDKDVEITTPATFTNTVEFSAGMLLPTDADFISCLGPDKGALRTVAATNNLQICDGAGNWLPVGVRTLDALDDVPAYGAAGSFLRVNGTADGVAFSSASLLDLSDTPNNFTGDAGRFLRVNGTASGVIFSSAALLDLADTPDSFAGSAGRFVRVNGTADGVAFSSASLLDLSDTPNSFAGAAGHALVVNGAGNAVEFVSSSLFVGPQGPVGAQGPQGPAGAQGPAGPAGADGADAPDNFLGLTDTPNAYTGQGGKSVKVKTDESGLEFGTGGALDCELVESIAPNNTNNKEAICPNDRLLMGGGCIVLAGSALLVDLFPKSGPFGGVNMYGGRWECEGASWVTARAICCKM